MVSLGCGSATTVPMVVGYFFTHVGPTSIWHFNTYVACWQAITAAYLLAIFKKNMETMKYSRLAQEEEEELDLKDFH